MPGKENFVITQEKTEGNIKLTVIGHIDSNNAVELECKLDDAVRDCKTNIILNMCRVEYLCSTGIRVILKAYKNAKTAGYGFGIEKPSDCVKNVLGAVALNEMLIQ